MLGGPRRSPGKLNPTPRNGLFVDLKASLLGSFAQLLAQGR